MSFDTPGYVLFLCVLVPLYRLCPRRFRRALLLGASLFFYACWSVPLTAVILGVAGLTYACGLAAGGGAPRLRRPALIAAIAGCLGLLVWFKYFNFLAGAVCAVLGGRWTPLDILLPVGCSFYTFQALSYVIDVYRGRLPAERRFGRYALYICFFPQLVAGPIERADALLPQLNEAPDASGDDLRQGLKLLLAGYFRKLAIADVIAPVADRVFAAARAEGSAVLLGAALFGLQIYCDFAGYSEIAMGSARLLGIRLRRNFDRPYLARTVRGFWRRWHMSLTAWFTDYVYIPLGGNRRGRARRIAAVLAVFLLSGLWHGADWTFVMWGLWHGLTCAGEILWGRKEENAPARGWRAAGGRLLTLAAVTLPWVLFRAESAGRAAALYGALFSRWDPAAGLRLLGTGPAEALCLGLGLAQLPLLHRLSEGKSESDLTYFFLGACALATWFLRAGAGGTGAFIYFQF